jgi:hypothetical protein
MHAGDEREGAHEHGDVVAREPRARAELERGGEARSGLDRRREDGPTDAQIHGEAECRRIRCGPEERPRAASHSKRQPLARRRRASGGGAEPLRPGRRRERRRGSRVGPRRRGRGRSRRASRGSEVRLEREHHRIEERRATRARDGSSLPERPALCVEVADDPMNASCSPRDIDSHDRRRIGRKQISARLRPEGVAELLLVRAACDRGLDRIVEPNADRRRRLRHRRARTQDREHEGDSHSFSHGHANGQRKRSSRAREALRLVARVHAARTQSRAPQPHAATLGARSLARPGSSAERRPSDPALLRAFFRRPSNSNPRRAGNERRGAPWIWMKQVFHREGGQRVNEGRRCSSSEQLHERDATPPVALLPLRGSSHHRVILAPHIGGPAVPRRRAAVRLDCRARSGLLLCRSGRRCARGRTTAEQDEAVTRRAFSAKEASSHMIHPVMFQMK